jgi:hypothetical protein
LYYRLDLALIILFRCLDGLWVMGYGLWVMGYGLWVMGYGLWVMVIRDLQITKCIRLWALIPVTNRIYIHAGTHRSEKNNVAGI